MSETTTPPVLSPENPADAHGKIEINLDPSLDLSAQIRSTAIGERHDLIGLEIEDSSRRYVVIDSGIQTHVDDSPVIKKVGLPHFRRGENGSLSFRRPITATNEKPKPGSLPRYVRRGKLQSIERPKVPIDRAPIEVPIVAVEVWDIESGDLLEIMEQPQKEFYNIADKMDPNQVKARWNPRPESIVQHKDLPLELTGHDEHGRPLSEFDEVTRQLEARNITTWEGVNWRRGAITEEVVRDVAMRKRASNGFGYQWVRTIAVKTTRDGQEPRFEFRNVYQFASWLKAINADRGEGVQPITDLRLSKGETENEILSAREATMYRYFGWLAVPKSPTEMDQDFERQNSLEARIKSQLTDDSPEGLTEEEDRIAVLLLDYPDILNDDRRRAKVTEMISSPQDKRRVKTLKDAITRHGLLAVQETATQFREAYLLSVKKLAYPVSREEQSISQVFEIIADILVSHPDLLYNDSQVQAAKKDIADILVGRSVTKIVSEKDGKEAYDKSLIQLRRQMTPSGELNAQGQPAYEIREQLEFNDGFFTAFDGPAIHKDQIGVWKKTELLRKPTRDLARSIFEKIRRGEVPNPEEYAKLGRALRRSVGD